MQIISPASPLQLSSNNTSCVLKVTLGQTALLLAGDIDRAMEREIVGYWGSELASEVLLAPHHGSRSSSSYPLIKAIGPELVVFSAGYRNQFGHPHPDVVGRYTEAGARLLGTDYSGAISFKMSPGGVGAPREFRGRWKPYWM